MLFFFYFAFFFFSLDIHDSQDSRWERSILTPIYHFHPLQKHLDISQAIAAKSPPQNIASDQTGTENLWFLSASC